LKFLYFLFGGISALIFQLFFGGTLYIVYGFIALFFFPNNSAPHFIETIIFAGLYGVGWFFYWKRRSVLSINESFLNMQELIWEVFMATLPIIVILIIFDPSPNHMAMIPTSFEEYRYIFMLYFITLILFPIYSLLLNRYVFLSKTSQCRKTAIMLTLIFLIGISCSYISWSIMPMMYKRY
jgi:hypothetical protein